MGESPAVRQRRQITKAKPSYKVVNEHQPRDGSRVSSENEHAGT